MDIDSVRLKFDAIQSEKFKMIQLDLMLNESSWCNLMWKWEILKAEWIKLM